MKIKLFENGFDFGIKEIETNTIISYSITNHIPLIDDKASYGRKFVRQFNRGELKKKVQK